MFTWRMCRFPFWPIRPFFGLEARWGVLAILGIFFSLIMLLVCLKRPASKFYNPLTKEAEYDKLIWAVAILLSVSFYFIGTIAYFFVIKRARPENKE